MISTVPRRVKGWRTAHVEPSDIARLTQIMLQGKVLDAMLKAILRVGVSIEPAPFHIKSKKSILP